MSIPSTATVALPSIHTSHYAYPTNRLDHYQSGTGTYDNIRNPSTRLAPSYPPNHHISPNTRTATSSSSRQLPIPTSMAPQLKSESQRPIKQERREDRRPNWEEFFKNGVPQEIIVIRDTEEPEPPKPEAQVVNRTTRTVVRGGGTPEHAAKKRKTAANRHYDARNFSYSNARPTQLDASASGTISTDRTTSLHTTAPTSLGSHGSHGSGAANHAEDQAVAGQKRKRVTRQQVAADAKRRKEIEEINDPHSLYVPPRKPIAKAPDVHVQPVRDVSTPCALAVLRLIFTDHDPTRKGRRRRWALHCNTGNLPRRKMYASLFKTLSGD